MDKIEAKKKIEKLRKDLSYYMQMYFDDKQVVTDLEYDMLMQELRKLEAQFPEFEDQNSPTQRFGVSIKSGFEKVEHEVPLLSLQDIFSFEELDEFDERVQKAAKEYDIEELVYVVETKIDGLSVALEYKKGEFIRGATRGNGQVGEDVTDNLRTIGHIPKRLTEEIDIIVRGEVFIGKEAFEKMNEENQLEEKSLFANARNAAAGSLRQQDSSVTAKRPLDIYIFNVQKIEGKKFNSHYEELLYLEQLGFNVNPVKVPCHTIPEAIQEIQKIGDNRENLSFGIDGAVIKVDNLFLRQKMGNTYKAPRWAIAYKYPPEKKQTILKDIVCNVGRTGAITPMAILEPVKVAGSTIAKTTLHNEDFIKEKDLKIGDTIVIQKAGDVIPEVVEVIKEKRTGKETTFHMPKVCPVCGGPAIREEGEAAIRCIGIECPAKLLRNMEHFVSKEAMDISGLGYAIVEQLIEKKLIQNIGDIYTLTIEEIASLKQNGKKFAQNLMDSIEASKKNDLHRLITGLGIRHVGVKAAKGLAKKYQTMDALMQAEQEELSMTEDIGAITAESIYEFFHTEQTKDVVERLKIAGVNMQVKEAENADNRFQGKTFVLTGSLEVFTRTEASNIIEKLGGKTSGSVSAKTDYLLAGEAAGSKLKKAQELGVKVITEKQFQNMIK